MKEFVKVGDSLYHESTIKSFSINNQDKIIVVTFFCSCDRPIYHIYNDLHEFNKDKEILIKTLRKE